MITGTYNLIADPSWGLIQFQEVRLECDTTLGPVTINLPAISTLTQSTNLKLIVVDATANANTNNITVNSDGSDTFDDSVTNQIVLDTDGSSVIFQNVALTQWIATDSVNGANNQYNDILYADLYNKIINKQLIPGGKYRLLNYKSVNFLNGVDIASSNPTPIDPSFNPRQVYVGPNEILLLEAISDYQLSPIAISEQYPQDIIQFQGFTNKIGVGFNFSNGQVLPDSTVITGFDLQWDGTNAYFNMPTNYPALFGQKFYLYADFNGGSDYVENDYFILTPFTPEPIYQYVGGAIQTNIQISSNGYKIILTDLTFTDFQNYDTGTLNVGTIIALNDSYGCITRRDDTYKNINVPFDFRSMKYRRYEVDLSSNTAISLIYAGIGDNPLIAGFNRPTTGSYIDYSIFPENCYNIYWEGIGGYSFENDNNVFTNSCYEINLGTNAKNNTCTNFAGNSIKIFFQQNILLNASNNNLANQFSNNISTVFSQNFTSDYALFNILEIVTQNTFLGPFTNNKIQGSYKFNVTGSIFANNVIGTGFESNQIGDYFQNNLNIGNNFQNNIISNGFKDNLNIGNNFLNNVIGYNFRNNSTILNFFQNNKIGNDFKQNTTIGNDFKNNIIGNNFSVNVIDDVFQQNKIGDSFSDNINIGYAFQSNIINDYFQRNNISNQFQLNTIRDYFDDNTIGGYFQYNTLNSFFRNNNIGPTFKQNNIDILCMGNIIGNSFMSNTIGIEFKDNSIGNAFQYNTITNGFKQNIIGSSFQINTTTTPVTTLNFTAATRVYADYSCTILKGSDSNFYLAYFNGITQFFVSPTS